MRVEEGGMGRNRGGTGGGGGRFRSEMRYGKGLDEVRKTDRISVWGRTIRAMVVVVYDNFT